MGIVDSTDASTNHLAKQTYISTRRSYIHYQKWEL